jgi:hypothetical protein
MKSSKVLIILFAIIFARNIHAYSFSFSGGWIGSGKAVMKPGLPKEHRRNCSDISISLNQTESSLELIQGYYSCEDMNAEYSPAIFEIRNSEIWYQGKKIGSIASDKIFISYLDPDGGDTFQLELILKDGKLQYEENWLVDNISQLRVTGELSLKK